MTAATTLLAGQNDQIDMYYSSGNWFWQIFVEMWTHEFMVTGFLVTLFAAVSCALLSCWLVLVGWSLLGDALSHAVLPGVVLAYVFAIPFAIGAMISALICVALIGVVRFNPRIKQDAAIGVVFTTLFAIGIVLISIFPSQIHLDHVLFGDLLGIEPDDFYQVMVIAPISVAIIWYKRKDLTLFAFDPAHASAIGLSTNKLTALLIVCLALTVVVAMQAVGAILIVALLIIPGATARLCTNVFWRMLYWSVGISTLSVTLGIYLSYWLNTASGATVVAVHGLVFFIFYLLAPNGLKLLLKRRKRVQAAG